MRPSEPTLMFMYKSLRLAAAVTALGRRRAG
jgi:hypothetical protein